MMSFRFNGINVVDGGTASQDDADNDDDDNAPGARYASDLGPLDTGCVGVMLF